MDKYQIPSLENSKYIYSKFIFSLMHFLLVSSIEFDMGFLKHLVVLMYLLSLYLKIPIFPIILHRFHNEMSCSVVLTPYCHSASLILIQVLDRT